MAKILTLQEPNNKRWQMDLVHWILITFLTLVAAGHALLYKRDPRAAWGWIAVCLMFPLVGPILYFLFGINRVRTRAKQLDRQSPFRIDLDDSGPEELIASPGLSLLLPQEVADIARISTALTRWPLVGGNAIEMLHSGEEAYPRMLEEIEAAQHSILLTTYIFETNHTGRSFIQALAGAANRGVDVKVMIDGVGEWYSFPRAGTLLKKQGVRVARFLPPTLFPPTVHVNLRNHRKILIVDGRTAFVGGMNIGDRHLAGKLENPSRVVDAHFRLAGPVVSQIEHTFFEDWNFVTGDQALVSPSPPVGCGTAFCRTIVDGPNEELDKLTTILAGAISSARRRVLIMTPYFLPPRALVIAMQTAALRGVAVTVILPAKNNLPYVHWAARKMLWELVERGVEVLYQPPPFVHTKIFLVDDHYAQIGSANLDPRSLRLNFELAVEIYDKPVTQALALHMERSLEGARRVSLKELDGRPLPVRTRDAVAWLFSPYL